MVQNMRVAHSGRFNKSPAKLAKLTPLLKLDKIEENKKEDYLLKPSCCTKIENSRCNYSIECIKNRIIIENSTILGSLYLRNH